jgi:hypothetical protein
MTKREQYENACTAYVKEFCDKQDMDFGGWVGGTVGDVAYCSDFFFSMRDIVLDVNSGQPVGAIVEWYYSSIEADESVNYYAWTQGIRP